MPRPVAALWRLTWATATFAPLLLSSALRLELDPWQTDRPVPESIIFFAATRESGDPQFVNVALVNTPRNNQTVLFEAHDLVLLASAGFRLPHVPPGTGYLVRMTDTTSGRRILAESAEFEIYPVGTPPSSTAATSETMTATVLTNTVQGASATETPSTSESTEKASVPLGAIVGSVVGGVALLVIFGALLYCIRRQGRPITPEELEKKAQKDQRKKESQKGVISPFDINEPTPASPYSPETAASSAGASGSGSAPVATPQFESARTEKQRIVANQNYFTPSSIERLPTELTANSTIGESSTSGGSGSHHRATSSSDSRSGPRTHKRKKSKRPLNVEEYELLSPSTATMSSRTAVNTISSGDLKRERDRLKKEIADLERRSSMGGSRAPRRNNTDNDEMLAQLEGLRERVNMLDSTLGSPRRRARTMNLQAPPDEPPPEYPGSVLSHSRG